MSENSFLVVTPHDATKQKLEMNMLFRENTHKEFWILFIQNQEKNSRFITVHTHSL